MDIKELKQKMREINEREGEDWDSENAHMAIDELLLEYINDEEVMELFWDVEKWYA